MKTPGQWLAEYSGCIVVPSIVDIIQHEAYIKAMDGWWSQRRGVWWVSPRGSRVMISDVPNYPECLNACAEFEATLDDLGRWKYCDALVEALQLSGDYYAGWSMDDFAPLIFSTPLQRCEAFLRVKGLWRDQ